MTFSVLRYDGRIVPARSVQIGDELMGPDSKPRRVIDTCVTFGPTYRIVPVSGNAWECGEGHSLTVHRRVCASGKETRRNKARVERGEVAWTDTVIDVPVAKIAASSQTERGRYRLFQPAIVEFAPCDADRPITPYFLGIWLGDGTKNLNGTAITKPDAEIIAACEYEAARFGLHVNTRTDPRTGCPTHHIVRNNGGNLPNPLTTILRSLMPNGACVPPSYLLSSYEVRLEVLAGLLDTDGHLSNETVYEIAQRSLPIANDVAFLARSVGTRVTHGVKIVNGRDYQRLFIMGNLTRFPLRIPRKKPVDHFKKNDSLYVGFKVKTLPDADHTYLTLDGDGRFLLGDFTVTRGLP